MLELRDYAPSLANDPDALQLRTLAELALARAQLAAGDRYAAAATIDATLETLAGADLDLERLGPSLGALVEERRRLLSTRGVARLRVECSRACRVLVDEHNAGDVEVAGSARELSLPLGQHRVWVESLATDSDCAPMRTQVELDAADTTVVLHYPDPAAGSLPAPRLTGREGQAEFDIGLSPPRPRLAPRWVEATTLALGGAALIAGAVMWAIDSQCPGSADINDPLACPELYDTRTGGIALVSAGIAAAATGGVMLIVDETRVGDRRSRELGLLWTTRF